MIKPITREELLQRGDEAVALLRKMVSINSVSGKEEGVTDLINEFLISKGFQVQRCGENLIVISDDLSPDLPVLMLNSHIDTVLPSEGYTRDPFDSGNDNNVVLGLGSNDAGASVVSMIQTFIFFASAELPFRIMLLLSAQEENSGSGGISLALKNCPRVDAAVVGEPTKMKAAIAERGLLVIDAVAKGVSGHAARNEGVNALYIALEDIDKLRNFRFDKKSDLMGDVKLSVTTIKGGNLHNVVPDKCSFTIDIRPTECYSNKEITTMLQQEVKSHLNPRNLNNKCSLTPPGSPLLKALEQADFETYVSPTTSDWMRLNCPAIKMGPGDSSRSHRPDEYVTKDEIISGIDGYIRFVNNLKF